MSVSKTPLQNLSNEQLVQIINDINNKLGENLKISTNSSKSWNKRRNIDTLAEWFDNQRAGYVLPLNFTLDDINNYINNLYKRRIKHEDDEYFNSFNRDDYKKEDPIDVYTRIISQDRFNKQRVIEDRIRTAREALDDAINLIRQQQHTILQNNDRLIIPDAPLIKNKQNYYTPENEELYDYLDKHYTKFSNKHRDFLIINEPHDLDRAVEQLVAYDKYKETDIKERKDNGKPIITYYFNSISSLDDIYEALQEVYNKEVKPFKIHFQLSGVFETQEFDYETYEEKYTYEAREIIWKNYKSSIPIIVKNKQNLEECKLYIETVLSSYETTTSNNKLSIVNSIAFTVSRMRKVSGHIKDLPIEFKKQHNNIIVDDEDDNLCWYRFLACCLYPEFRNTKKYKIIDRTKKAKKLLLEEHGITYTTKIPEEGTKILNTFQGITMEDMKESAEKHKINVDIYEYHKEEKYYDLQEQWYFNKDFTNCSALLFTQGLTVHIMYITDAEKLTSIHICPKCHSYTHHGHQNLNRFNEHVKHCDGKFKQQFIPVKEALPYCPHILNNPVYEYCLAHNIEWKPNIYYITYDFETMEEHINQTVGKSTTINSRLIPLSVASCVRASTTTTKSFSLRTSNTFISDWIDWLFEQSLIVYKDKLSYSCVPLEIDNNINTITILGFNSSRFDSNLFKQYLNTNHWKVECNSIIGTLSSLKQFVLISSKYPTKLRFIDAQSFVAGGTLKQFGEDFGNTTSEKNSSKGVFPYEAINSENYNDVLSKSEPFKYEDFYSYLNQRNPLSKKDYEQYVEDSKKYSTRWDYLLAYNENDVEMMIKPIDNLIKMNAEYKVDLLSNLSLSKNAACIKYALAYKDFNPEQHYGIVNEKNTFKPTLKWWIFKCNNYYNQDSKFNLTHPHNKQLRNLDKCVNKDDYKEFLKMYDNSCCHLCGEHFTPTNRPTLDRIDNDIGHELSNCKLACAECNKLRKRDDPKITSLRINLKKYCKINHLPTLINDEEEYYSLRNNITGGLSNVMHRYNIKGETHINKFRFELNKGIISYDTPNVMTHIVGVDFNSLYPSSFSSTKHDFNKYHGGIMYMPGSFVRRITDKQKCLNIINSKTRFQPEPKFLFKAEVKLSCPKCKLNYFINFPPIFRNINIKNTEETIGSYMYNYLQQNKLATIDKEERKLTMLVDTCGEYMTFSNYYLWFLLDHGLVLDDVKSVSIYEAQKGFGEFVSTFMSKRQNILSGLEKGSEKFYKISMNGSYGYDGMNTEKYAKIKICDRDKAYQYIISETYMNGAQLAENLFMIQQKPKYYHCSTCLQESFWTLDNAKYWYLTFYYDFMNRCLDMNRLHFIEGDSDSLYLAVAGNPNEGPEQLFYYVIKDRAFWDKHVYKFFPNPELNSVADEKKILGCAIEKTGENMIALAPKCYTIWNNNGQTKSLKLKGVSLKKNNIVSEDYNNVLLKNSIKLGQNINLQMNGGKMSKLTVNKNALTGCHTKMIVLPNQSCAPFITGFTTKDYFVENRD